MASKKLTLADVKARPLDNLLHEVLENKESVTVVVEDGQELARRPIELKPLPELKGSIPPGWKDGIYTK